jgi:dethiobiotin synthetase
MSIIIAGIHTGIGKTVCSAIICQAMGYDYWKPVQAGDLDNSDSRFIIENVTNPTCSVHPERYRLSLATSPHYAASRDGLEIRPADFTLPATANPIVIETAGGVMSPLSSSFLNIDLIQLFNLPVVLVSSDYLGSINHTLLTVYALRQRGIPIEGLVFSGEETIPSGVFIIEHTKLPLLFSIPQFDRMNADAIAFFAKTIYLNL